MKKRFFIIPLFGVLAIAAFGAIVMLLWNFVVPGVLGLATINFWQALALFALARILFGGFPSRRGFPGRRGMPSSREGNPFRAKWEKMTPEERKDFINRRKKFGFGGPFGGDRFFDENNFDRNNSSETPKENE
mgnify:FL=1